MAEIARGGLLKGGLGICDNDVSAVLNICDNHIGSDGIRSRQDLAKIKGLVARSGAGHLVLNADDPLVMSMAGQTSPDRQVLIAQQPESSAWNQHMAAGHTVASYQMKKDSRILLFHRAKEVLAIDLRAVPASEDGAVLAIAPAAAFAAAMAHCIGIDAALILQGLSTFGCHASHLQGRYELFIAEPYRVVITKAGSPQAMRSVSSYARETQPPASGRRILLSVEGDAQVDSMLRTIGRAVEGFEAVIFASRDIRNGRNSADEVPRLLAEGAAASAQPASRIIEAGTESEALAMLVRLLRPGDLCVISNFNVIGTKQKLAELIDRETVRIDL